MLKALRGQDGKSPQDLPEATLDRGSHAQFFPSRLTLWYINFISIMLADLSA